MGASCGLRDEDVLSSRPRSGALGTPALRRALLALLLPGLAPGAAAQVLPPEPRPEPPAVVGVVVAAAPSRSVAVLRSGARTRVVAIGESAFGARLLRVSVDGATVDVGGRESELRLPVGAATLAVADTPAAEPSTPPATGGREMDRAELQRRLATEATRIVAETTLLPVWDAGRVAGFTISRVPEGTVLSEAGIEAGDVLTHVNDVPIDSLATLVGLWPRLQSATTVQADLVRGGQPLRLQIKLK